MRINFCSRIATKHRGEEYTASLSLGEKSFKPARKRLFLDFDDTTHGSSAPTYDHVLRAADFIESLGEKDSLLINCMAGRSRSAAITVLALVLKNSLSYETALNSLADYRIDDDSVLLSLPTLFVDLPIPNPLILKHIKTYLCTL